MVNAEEIYGIVLKMPSEEKQGIILDADGEYYDFTHDIDSIIYQSKDKSCILRVGDMVGFKRYADSIAKQLRKVRYY